MENWWDISPKECVNRLFPCVFSPNFRNLFELWPRVTRTLGIRVECLSCVVVNLDATAWHGILDSTPWLIHSEHFMYSFPDAPHQISFSLGSVSWWRVSLDAVAVTVTAPKRTLLWPPQQYLDLPCLPDHWSVFQRRLRRLYWHRMQLKIPAVTGIRCFWTHFLACKLWKTKIRIL